MNTYGTGGYGQPQSGMYGTTGYGGYSGYGTGAMYYPPIQPWLPFLHFDPDEYVLFDFWRTGTPLGMFLSCLVVGAIAACFEAALAVRELYGRRGVDAAVTAVAVAPAMDPQAAVQNDANNAAGAAAANNNAAVVVGGLKAAVGHMKKVRILPVAAELGLYAVQLLAGYALLVVAMSLNVWLILGMICGHLTSRLAFTLLGRTLAAREN